VEAVPAFFSGLLFCLSLIVAVGAQNAFVLRQGAMRCHVGTVIVVCCVSDALLIGASVGGIGGLVSGHRGVLSVVRDVGATLLLVYAGTAARRVLSAPSDPTARAAQVESRARVVAATFAFTWLNPAVYLDVILLGSVASSHPASRWWFGAGATTASIGWFIALGFGARLLSPALRHRHAARVLDMFVTVVMIAAAVRTLPV
jgi:L-lysine exporter family protein LysE/ArgO